MRMDDSLLVYQMLRLQSNHRHMFHSARQWCYVDNPRESNADNKIIKDVLFLTILCFLKKWQHVKQNNFSGRLIPSLNFTSSKFVNINSDIFNPVITKGVQSF